MEEMARRSSCRSEQDCLNAPKLLACGLRALLADRTMLDSEELHGRIAAGYRREARGPDSGEICS